MSRYSVYIHPRAFREFKHLPAQVKNRIKREIRTLSTEPRPPKSKSLESSESNYELRRIRLDRWRIIYTIVESDNAIDVLAIRKRPPYDYGDLEELLREIE